MEQNKRILKELEEDEQEVESERSNFSRNMSELYEKVNILLILGTLIGFFALLEKFADKNGKRYAY